MEPICRGGIWEKGQAAWAPLPYQDGNKETWFLVPATWPTSWENHLTTLTSCFPIYKQKNPIFAQILSWIFTDFRVMILKVRESISGYHKKETHEWGNMACLDSAIWKQITAQLICMIRHRARKETDGSKKKRSIDFDLMLCMNLTSKEIWQTRR